MAQFTMVSCPFCHQHVSARALYGFDGFGHQTVRYQISKQHKCEAKDRALADHRTNAKERLQKILGPVAGHQIREEHHDET